MIRRHRGIKERGRPLLLALIIFAVGSMAHAQDLDEVEQPRVMVNVYELDETYFNQWIFGNVRRNVTAREYLDMILAIRVEEVARACDLSESQKQKIRLAGQGDLKRFSDRVAEAKATFDRLRRDQSRINEIRQETQALATTLAAGLFGAESLFSKSLGSTLRPEQIAGYRDALHERAQFRYKAKVQLCLAKLDATAGFTATQSRRLLDLILAETTPLEKPAGQHEDQVVLFKIAGLPESKFRTICDDAQWEALKTQFEQVRRLERFFRTNGYLEPAANSDPD